MGDDEAFIRAIVDAPGDDAPRLVYADWLDERGDPRAAYLRAEVVWARPWRAGDRRPRDRDLSDLADGLEPIWVARVSRPPMGVCLDRLRILRPGPPLSRDDIRTFERGNLLRLPDALVALLFNHNGGTPNRRRRVGFFRRGFGSVRMLPPVNWTPAIGASNPLTLTGILSDPAPGSGEVLEFADDRAVGGYFIGVSPGKRGVIYYTKNREPGTYPGEFGLEGIAPSLPELLAFLN
jgi:uncharacterized protein (TIGR02996 family)